MRLLTIFLDSSVILSGLASSTGGSRKLFIATEHNRLKLLTTPLVIQEVFNHLEKLFIEPNQLENLLSRKVIRLISNPNEETIEKFSQASSDPNDIHVLAGAGLSGAKVLISLDKKHILTPKVRKILKPMLVKSPKDFWCWLGELKKIRRIKY